MRKSYSRAVRLSATFLGRLAGTDVAAKTFGVDPRTVRSWLRGGDVPADTWTAVRDLCLPEAPRWLREVTRADWCRP